MDQWVERNRRYTLIDPESGFSIDFAGTGREVILYIYDYEKYKEDKGFYLDVTELPFKQAHDEDELEKCLHTAKKEYELDAALLADNRGDSARRRNWNTWTSSKMNLCA